MHSRFFKSRLGRRQTTGYDLGQSAASRPWVADHPAGQPAVWRPSHADGHSAWGRAA